MILEIATLYVNASRQKKFEEDFSIARQYISSTKGFLSLALQKSIEQNNKYILLVEWEKIEDHLIGFRQSAIYTKWKELLHHYYDPFPVVEHYETVLEER
jgi:heme-degrading monooxygenase HmoA